MSSIQGGVASLGNLEPLPGSSAIFVLKAFAHVGRGLLLHVLSLPGSVPGFPQ